MAGTDLPHNRGVLGTAGMSYKVGGGQEGHQCELFSLACRVLVAGSTWPTPHLQMGSTAHTELVYPNDGCISPPYHWEKWLTDEKLLKT